MYKKDLGFIGRFESLSAKPQKVSKKSIVPAAPDQTHDDARVPPKPEDSQKQPLEQEASKGGADVVESIGLEAGKDGAPNAPPADPEAPEPAAQLDSEGVFKSETGDEKLLSLERRLRNSAGKPTKVGELVDTWCEVVDHAREEDYYSKRYWAFLNGYLNLKMAQLLENELSIIETSV